jgi:hypothetical protein
LGGLGSARRCAPPATAPVAQMGLESGARVTVPEDSIFDYIYRRADGGVEGNETAALRQKRAPR